MYGLSLTFGSAYNWNSGGVLWATGWALLVWSSVVGFLGWWSQLRPLGVRAYWFLVLVGAFLPLGFLVGLYQTFFFITASLTHGANHLSPADRYSELRLILAGVLQLSIVSVGAAAFGWSVIPRIARRDSQT